MLFEHMLADLWTDVPQEVIDDVLHKCDWLNAHIVPIYGIGIGVRMAINFFLGV